MKKCCSCLETLLEKHLHEHESKCDYVQVTCDICRTIYRPRDGHESMTCLRYEMKNQQDRFERILTTLTNISQNQTDALNNLNQQLINLTETFNEKLTSIESKQTYFTLFDSKMCRILDLFFEGEANFTPG